MARIALIAAAAIGGALLSVATGGLGTFAVGAWAADIIAGASVGASIGGVLGSIIFPPRMASTPPLNDLQVMSSAPGNPIPWGYGSYRIAGNAIWANPIQEKTSQQSTSGKGGPTSTVYTYTVDLAISFGYGPGNITRIWADSKLIYDVTSKAPISIDTGLSHSSGRPITVPFKPTIYTGTAVQDADPTIQASEGVDSTPAFRNQIYMVLEAFPLADFGNRVPSFRAEISSNASLSYVKNLFPGANIIGPGESGVEPPTICLVDPFNRYAYILDSEAVVVQKLSIDASVGNPVDPWEPFTAYPIGAQVLDSNGNVELATNAGTSAGTQPTWPTGETDTVRDHGSPVGITWENIGAGPNAISIIAQGPLKIGRPITPGGVQLTANAVDGAGNLWTQQNLTGGSPNGEYMVEFSPSAPPRPGLNNSQQASNFVQIGEVYLAGVAAFSVIAIQSTKTGKNYLYVVTSFPSLQVIDCAAQAIIFTSAGQLVNLSPTCVPIVDPSTGKCYVLFYNSGVSTLVTVDVLGGGATETWVLPTSINGGEFTQGGWFDTADGTLILAGSNGNLWKVDPATQTVLSFTSSNNVISTAAADVLTMTKGYDALVPPDGVLKVWYNPALQDVLINYVDCATLATVNTVDIGNWFVADGTSDISGFAYDPLTDSAFITRTGSPSYTGLSAQIFFDRQSVGGEAMGDVVADLWAKTGADPALLDTSLLEGVTCTGYPVTQTANPAGLLKPLCIAYFFDMVESDNLLRAIPRGQSVTTIIPEIDMGLESDGFEDNPQIAQENDLPKTITIVYYDPSQNYQQAKQQYQRNARVKRTKNETVISLPLTLQPDEAAQIAGRALQTVWAERNKHEFKLWRLSYLTIDPTDIVQFTYNGKVYEARVDKTSVGQNMTTSITAVSEDPRQYVSVLVGSAITGFQTGTIKSLGPTVTFILDTPFVTDSDNEIVGSTGYYWLMSNPVSTSSWPGGVLFTSSDGLNFGNGIALDTTPAVFGTVLTTTPAPLNLFSTDNTTVINVVVSAALTGDTVLDVLNGSNWFFLGGELMAFQTATLQSDGSYNLTGLLRGLRGTEAACGTHVAGETLLMITPGLQRTNVPTSLIGALQYLRGVTVGLPVSAGTSQQVTLQGNDLKPYAPASFGGTVDGSFNINMTWIRRTRIGGEADWGDGVTSVPLSEESELYTVEIFDSMGNLKRTVTGLTSPLFQYTAAMQTTDFGSDQASVVATVWQISASVGKGFPTTNATVGLGNLVTS